MPITAAVWVIVEEASAIARAMPKSITLTSPVGREHHVAGLDVAVDDAGAVAVVERGEHAAGDLERPLGQDLAALAQDVAQGAALDVLHDDVGLGDAACRRSPTPRRCRRPRRSPGGSARRPTAPRGGTGPGTSASRARSVRSSLIGDDAAQPGVAARGPRPCRRARAAHRARSGRRPRVGGERSSSRPAFRGSVTGAAARCARWSVPVPVGGAGS